MLGNWMGREREGRGSSPRCQIGAKTARDGGFARRAENSGDGFSLRAGGWEQRRGEGEVGEENRSGARRWLSNLKTEARGGESWARGLRPGRFQPRERDSGARRLEEGGGSDGWAPPISRQRERGGREGSRLGQAQEGGRGARGFGPNGRKGGKGEREKFFLFFYFPPKFF